MRAQTNRECNTCGFGKPFEAYKGSSAMCKCCSKKNKLLIEKLNPCVICRLFNKIKRYIYGRK